MNHNTVKSAVIQALNDIQRLSGNTTSPIRGTTCPIGDLPGYDSMRAVETASLISSELGFDINPALMISDNPQTTLTVDDITNRIVANLTVEDPPQGGNNEPARS